MLMQDFKKLRNLMVENQLKRRGIKDSAVLKANRGPFLWWAKPAGLSAGSNISRFINFSAWDAILPVVYRSLLGINRPILVSFHPIL
jgi:hypothetical protein